MIVTMNWDDAEQTMLYVGYRGAWDLDTFRESVERSVRLITSVGHRVHIIVCAEDEAAQTPPPWTLRTWRYTMLSAPSNSGITVVVPDNATVRALALVLGHLAGERYQGKIFAAATIDAARQLIRSLDAGESS